MTGSDSAREVVICASRGADHLACARKASMGGRLCCDACTHVTIRHQTPSDLRPAPTEGEQTCH